MKLSILLGLALLAPFALAQTHKPKPCLEEEIPSNGVEPAGGNYFNTTGYFCPRDDFKLEWYVRKIESTVYQSNEGSYTTYSSPMKNAFQYHYEFIPLCVKKESPTPPVYYTSSH